MNTLDDEEDVESRRMTAKNIRRRRQDMLDELYVYIRNHVTANLRQGILSFKVSDSTHEKLVGLFHREYIALGGRLKKNFSTKDTTIIVDYLFSRQTVQVVVMDTYYQMFMYLCCPCFWRSQI